MDAAFENPFENHRLLQRTHDGLGSMPQSLTESEFERAVADGMPVLVSVARRLVGDEELAAEAVQNALLKASKSWRKFRCQAHVQTWLTRIVIHSARDVIAAEKRLNSRNRPLSSQHINDTDQEAIDPKRGPADQIQDSELRSTIRIAVGQLPNRQREVFSLIVWQEMSADDVGILLGLNTQNVHANLHAAKKRLRQLLEKHEINKNG